MHCTNMHLPVTRAWSIVQYTTNTIVAARIMQLLSAAQQQGLSLLSKSEQGITDRSRQATAAQYSIAHLSTACHSAAQPATHGTSQCHAAQCWPWLSAKCINAVLLCALAAAAKAPDCMKCLQPEVALQALTVHCLITACPTPFTHMHGLLSVAGALRFSQMSQSADTPSSIQIWC